MPVLKRVPRNIAMRSPNRISMRLVETRAVKLDVGAQAPLVKVLRGLLGSELFFLDADAITGVDKVVQNALARQAFRTIGAGRRKKSPMENRSSLQPAPTSRFGCGSATQLHLCGHEKAYTRRV